MQTESSLHQAIQDRAPQLVAWRRTLHQFPEAGWTEFRTASLGIRHLQSLGYTVRLGKEAANPAYRTDIPPQKDIDLARARALEQGADPALVASMEDGFTGFWGDLTCGDGKGPLIAFRFDMDCNEMTEASESDHRPAREGFVSAYPGLMHACGHDGHVAIGLGLAEALLPLRDQLRGRIRLIFQPAEEGARGAFPMIQAGAVDGVDIFIGTHIGFKAQHSDELVCGTCQILATSKLDVLYTGKAAHAGAAPEEGKNALQAACSAILNLYAIPRHSGGITRINVGRLQAGTTRNAIPSSAQFLVETRGETSQLDHYMRTEAERIINAAAAMWDCSCEIIHKGSLPSGDSDQELASLIEQAASEMGCYQHIFPRKEFGAAEDCTLFMAQVREQGGLVAYIQAGTERADGHHNPRFDFDEICLPRTVELLCRLVCRML